MCNYEETTSDSYSHVKNWESLYGDPEAGFHNLCIEMVSNGIFIFPNISNNKRYQNKKYSGKLAQKSTNYLTGSICNNNINSISSTTQGSAMSNVMVTKLAIHIISDLTFQIHSNKVGEV